MLYSKLPVEKCQPLKIQDFGIFYRPSSFSDISALNISETVTPKPINHTIHISIRRLFRYT